MEKLDLKKQLRALIDPPKHDFDDIAVPTMSFVKVDGAGNPYTAALYRQAVEWLYGVSYAIKFAAKNELGRDYVVPPLEALWWSNDPGAFARRERNRWQWTVLIMTPDFVTTTMVEDAVAKTLAKRNDDHVARDAFVREGGGNAGSQTYAVERQEHLQNDPRHRHRQVKAVQSRVIFGEYQGGTLVVAPHSEGDGSKSRSGFHFLRRLSPN